MIDRRRSAIAGIVLSASALVGIIMHEGYSDTAITPVPGDVPTIGFGTTGGVKMGDRITPPRAVARALTDIQKFEGAVKQCVKVPLAQNEYDAYISLSYNIGATAFCRSTLVKKLNALDYAGACLEVLKWDKFKGQPLRGLTIRRQAEYKQCRGES
jgi:lysozyme